MSAQLRSVVATHLATVICDVSAASGALCSAGHIFSQLQVTRGSRADEPHFLLTLPRSAVPSGVIEPLCRRLSAHDSGRDGAYDVTVDGGAVSSWLRGCWQDEKSGSLTIGLCKRHVCAQVLSSILTRRQSFWRPQSPGQWSGARDACVVDFSSPNIAKPLHMGHLRSTMIGNFLCNALTATDTPVVRLNYLGDWGTQFGLLSVGCDTDQVDVHQLTEHLAETQTDSDQLCDSDERDTRAVDRLLDVYVAAATAADKDPAVKQLARSRMQLLEGGDSREMQRWRLCRRVGIRHLFSCYRRLGVTFDAVHAESMYPARACEPHMQQLLAVGVAEQRDGAVWSVTEHTPSSVLLRTDGTPTYLMRDVAAAIDRSERFSRARLLYVVDDAQSLHLHRLSCLVGALNRSLHVEPVLFGRIGGVSSRRGGGVSLQQVLDEGAEMMRQRQAADKNSRPIGGDNDDTAHQIALSALLVNDLRRRRLKQYSFSWRETMAAASVNSGVRLQYCHCRLCSLERLNDAERLLSAEGRSLDAAMLAQLSEHPAAAAVVQLLAMFDEKLREAVARLEPCVFVVYLFRLAEAINVALGALRVRQQDERVQVQRLALFVAARVALGKGLQLVGMQPLSRM